LLFHTGIAPFLPGNVSTFFNVQYQSVTTCILYSYYLMDATMVTMSQQVEKFFTDYATRFNAAFETPQIDVEGMAQAFASHFIESSPKGVMCRENGTEFRSAIPRGIEFYKSIGTRSMRILSLLVTPLDNFHAMVKVHWSAHYVRKNGDEQTVDFEVIYFVQILDETPKIFAYITGDEEQLLREKGLTPEE
jgi:hypothetical protein